MPLEGELRLPRLPPPTMDQTFGLDPRTAKKLLRRKRKIRRSFGIEAGGLGHSSPLSIAVHKVLGVFLKVEGGKN